MIIYICCHCFCTSGHLPTENFDNGYFQYSNASQKTRYESMDGTGATGCWGCYGSTSSNWREILWTSPSYWTE